LTLRSRLVLAFAYILLAVIVALTVPLAINLSRRAEAELKTDTLQTAQTLAAYIGSENIDNPARLEQILRSTPPEIQRVVVMNVDGIVTYDSEGLAVGEQFNNGLRPEVATALQGQPFAEVRYSKTLGHNIMVAASPIIDEKLVGAIRLTRDFADVDAAIRKTVVGLGVIGLAGLGAGILIAFGLAGSIAQPIQKLARTARRLGGGDLSARAGDVEGTAEVKDLAHSFDEMAGRVERTVQSQREFVANASHQLRTPLTGMKLRLESAIAEAPTEEVRRQLEAADKEVDRLSEIVDRLLVMANQIEQGVPTHVDLGDAVRRAVERWHDRAAQMDSSLHVHGPSALAQANPTDIDQILDNLLDNAIAYAPGSIDVATGLDDGRAWFAVRDHGPGIPAGERDRVVERFYRGRSAPAGGSGLGLAIARELAEKWGGSLSVADAEGGGTEIRVGFRVVRTAVAVEQGAART
jgi:signal transduction histidine kinase